MKFNPKKVGFGRHETFSLRYSWLSKGVLALEENSEIFTSDDATVTLGVGKNMVNSIKFWLLATRMIEQSQGRGYELTLTGRAIFGKQGYDPYLEDEATIWLIHWLLVTNSKQATAWYWFFNQFHKPEFNSQEVPIALYNFVKQQRIKSAATTVKNDAAIVLRMYARSTGSGRRSLEEALDSPLSQLNLILQSASGRNFSSLPARRDGLPIGIFGYAISELFKKMGVKEIPIEDLMYSISKYPCPGAVFRMTESALLAKLETLILAMPGYYEMRETAGIHQIYQLQEVDPMKFLDFHYCDQEVVV